MWLRPSSRATRERQKRTAEFAVPCQAILSPRAPRGRSGFTPTPPGFSREARRLDAIAAADERDRQQRKQIGAMEADLIAHAKQGEMKPRL